MKLFWHIWWQEGLLSGKKLPFKARLQAWKKKIAAEVIQSVQWGQLGVSVCNNAVSFNPTGVWSTTLKLSHSLHNEIYKIAAGLSQCWQEEKKGWILRWLDCVAGWFDSFTVCTDRWGVMHCLSTNLHFFLKLNTKLDLAHLILRNTEPALGLTGIFLLFGY